MPDIDFKELHRQNPEGTERLLRDVMNYKLDCPICGQELNHHELGGRVCWNADCPKYGFQQEVMNYEKPGMFPNWGRAFLWLVVLPLLLILLGILLGKILSDIFVWAWHGFTVKPF